MKTIYAYRVWYENISCWIYRVQ